MMPTLISPSQLPPEQEAIRAKCFHPSGTFQEFKKEQTEQSVADRFEQQVAKYPDRLAVKTKSHVLTYAELNAMANRMARSILAQQGRDAEPVGLLFEKSATLMAAMLGVLKSGKFVVLLDPSFPKTRIRAVLEDSGARLVLADRQNASLATEVAGSSSRRIDFESIDRDISTQDLRLPILPKALAFLIYTSGSTGQPKGVVWNQRNLLHNVMLFANTYHLCEQDKLILPTSGTWNAVTNSLIPLLNGAALLPFDVQKEGVPSLASWLSQEKISICAISSPLLRNFAATLTGKERFPDLRILRLSSEAVYKTDVDLYKKYFSYDCLLVNGLNCTETGLLRTYLMDHKTEISGSEVPVGYPVQDKEIFLLDDEGKEIGFNEVGEIGVRSRYLSLGYWRRPDVSESKFRSDPEGGEEPLYLTGDLGLILPDGCLIHKGRKDFRVKVRGYRVEIAEVEKALQDHAAIRDAVVVARENESGEAYLVAYFTACIQPGPSVSQIRRVLQESLPDYMIPSNFVMLEQLPITAPGKIDRQALPEPPKTRPQLDTPFIPPRNPLERELARVWEEVLGKECVGMLDNFFDVGGNSLLATKILARVRDSFDIDVPLTALFEKPTINELARDISQLNAKQGRR
jgi:amino acid adenylation domain-containing protein